jgi:hypothetical protein
MQELLQYASAGRLREKAISVGDPIEEFRPTPGGGQEVRIRIPGPEQREESVRTQSLDDGSVLRWTDTDVSGIYRAFIGNDPHEYLYAVNVPTMNDQQASESDLTRTSHEELQKVYPEWETQIVTDLGQVVHGQGTVGSETVQRPLGPIIAHWLLLALLVLLFAEIVLAWQFGHYSSVSDESVPRPLGKAGWALYALAGLLFLVLLGGGFVLAHDAWTGDFLGFLPDGMRRSVEAWMDVPPPAPGEGSHWRLEYASYLWDASSDPWLAGAIACAAGVLVAWVYRREGRAPGSGFRIVMGGLRLGLIAVLLAVLLPQLKFWFERQGWPDVAILIDDSQSMSANDRYRDPRIQAAADRLARLVSITEPDRLRLAQALLTRSDPDWLTDLLTRRHVRVHVYHCSGRAHRLNDLSSAEDVAPALDSIRTLSADASNDSSQLGAAVRQVLNDFRGSSLAAVVMLTDGVTTEGEDLVKASKYASQMGVPLFFVGLGDAHEVRDVYLHDLQCEDSVYVNDRLVFDLRLTGQGYTDLTVPVELREKGKEEVLDRQMVKVDPNGKPVKVRLVHKPTKPGEKLYEIKVPKQADEVEEENNRIEKAVFVRESKLIKVLYVEGYRRYEYHFIKTLLERESDRTKGNKTIDLKVLLVEADPDYAVQDRSAISDFPPKSVLNTYDVVILGDVDPRPRDGTKMDEHVKDLADFVRERGGGLLMIAGERYAPHAYKNTALKDVLPIDVIADQQPDEPPEGRVEGYRPELSPVGRMHPIFRFHPEEKENDEIWSKLREMFWWSEGYQIKRAAEVLAVHPKMRAARSAERGAAEAALGPDKHPLVVQQFVGAGRAMFFGFNESWRWGFREDQLRFNQFWIQTIRYLSRSRLGRIDLRLDRPTAYRRGEPIKMKVRFPDDAPPPPDDTEVKVVVERRNKGTEADVRTVQLAKVEGTRASYEAVLTRTPEGDYKFWLSQPAAGNPKPRAECKVLAPPGEMERLRMNQQDMERAADESHGKFFSLADADRLLDELPAGTRVTLNAPAPPKLVWNSALTFLAVLLVLTTEWLLRKQKNLL